MTARTGRPRGIPPRITDLQVVSIYNAVRTGARAKDVAAQFGIHPNTVLEIYHARGRFRKIIEAALRIGWADNSPEIQDSAPVQRSKLFRHVPADNILHFALRRP